MKRLLCALFIALSIVTIAINPPVYATANIKFSYSKVVSKSPCQNSSVVYSAKVLNSKGKPLSGAKVTFKVYYKSTTTSYTAGNTNSSGVVSKKFKIGKATPNYNVKVVSKATKGSSKAVSTTYFKPKTCK
jgi:CRISPR/Cas system-associated exonuclease Cas4 (RecB family)